MLPHLVVQQRELTVAEKSAVAAFVAEALSDRTHHCELCGLLLLRIDLTKFGGRSISAPTRANARLLVAA